MVKLNIPGQIPSEEMTSESGHALFFQGNDRTWQGLRTRFKAQAESLMPGFIVKPTDWHSDNDDGFLFVDFKFEYRTETEDGKAAIAIGNGIADKTNIRIREVSIAVEGLPVATVQAFTSQLRPIEAHSFVNRLIKNINHGDSTFETCEQVN